MHSNPIPAIQSRLVEEIGFTGTLPARRKYFSLDFEYSPVSHPNAVRLDLACEFSWDKSTHEVHVVVYQPAASFATMDEAYLQFFYTNLTKVFSDEICNFVPDWGMYAAAVVPYKYSKDATDHHYAYLSCVGCVEYDLDEVVELTLASFGAGAYVLSHSQSLIKAMMLGERVLNIGEHIQKMKDQFAKQEKLLTAAS